MVSEDSYERRASNWLGLEGRQVLVVGAGAFGEAATRAFLEVGAKVALADIDADKLARIEDDLTTKALQTFRCDVSSRTGCASLVEEVASMVGIPYVLVHAVGINKRTPVDEITESEWIEVMRLNTDSCLWLGQLTARKMRQNGGGRIVYFSSVSGLLAHPGHGAYAASKGALNQLIRMMAIEWATHAIAVNGVAPGYALTPLTEEYCNDSRTRKHLLERIPLGRLAVPKDIVGPTLFLASDRSAYVTGQILFIDGGRTLD